jgi:cell division protease FtsH
MLGGSTQEPMFHREYSETTQQYIDEEIAHMMEKQYAAVKDQLGQNRSLLEIVAERLLETESLDEKEFKALLAAQNTPETVDSSKDSA